VDWVIGGALLPSIFSLLAALLTGNPLALAGTLLMPYVVATTFYARIFWFVSGRLRPVLGAVAVTALVLIPIIALMAIGLIPGYLPVAGILVAPAQAVLEGMDLATATEATILAVWVACAFGAVAGAVFMAIVSAFQHTLIPGEIPDVPGWVTAHMGGGAVAGALVGLAAFVEARFYDSVWGLLAAAALLMLSVVPHALLCWPVWRRSLDAYENRGEPREAVSRRDGEGPTTYSEHIGRSVRA